MIVNAQIMGKVKFGNASNEFNKTMVGEMLWAIDCKFPSPVKKHIDADLGW